MGGVDYYMGGKLNFGANKMSKEEFVNKNLPSAAKALGEKNVAKALSELLGAGVSKTQYTMFNIPLLGTSAAYMGGFTIAVADIAIYKQYIGCKGSLASGGTCKIPSYKVKFDESEIFTPTPSDYDITDAPGGY